MKAIKILFSIIGLLLLVCIFAIGSLVYFVDPDRLKPVLIEEVKKETGYQLAIDGKLAWSFYPRLAIKVQHVQLKKPQEGQVFLDANELHIATDLIALLRSRESLQGRISVSSLKLMNISMEKMSANISVKNKLLLLSSIKGSLYGGTLEGEASGEDLTLAPKWQWDLQCNHVQLDPLLQDANGTGSKIKISGTGSFRLQAQTRGIVREELLRQLDGSSTFSVEDGVISGIDLNYFLQLADASLNKKPVDQLVNTNQTSFKHFSGSALIQNGVAKSNDLLLIAPAFASHAEGSYELVSSNLDFELKLRPQLQNTKIKWDIPVLVTGDLHQPDVKLDFVAIQKMLASMEIEKLKEKAVTEIKKRIPGKTGEFLQNLLGK